MSVFASSSALSFSICLLETVLMQLCLKIFAVSAPNFGTLVGLLDWYFNLALCKSSSVLCCHSSNTYHVQDVKKVTGHSISLWSKLRNSWGSHRPFLTTTLIGKKKTNNGLNGSLPVYDIPSQSVALSLCSSCSLSVLLSPVLIKLGLRLAPHPFSPFRASFLPTTFLQCEFLVISRCSQDSACYWSIQTGVLYFIRHQPTKSRTRSAKSRILTCNTKHSRIRFKSIFRMKINA